MRFTSAIIVFSLVWSAAVQRANGQTPAILDDIPEKTKTEVWFGWVELPKQHLRTFVRIRMDANGKPSGASIVSADESPATINLTTFKNDGNKWSFQLLDPEKRTVLSFEGDKMSDELVKGELNLRTNKIPFQLVRTLEPAADTRATLDADSVWMGSVQKDGKEIQYRMRAYNSAPYATVENPKLLFDSLTDKIIGSPATLSTVAERATFDIETPVQKTKFIATLNEAQNELSGSLADSVNSILPMTMKLVLQKDKNVAKKETGADAKNAPTSSHETPSKATSDSNTSSRRTTRSGTEQQNAIENVEANGPKLISNSIFEEKRFDITYGGSKIKTRKHPLGTPGQRISGVLTLPRSQGGTSRRFPAVILVSGDGPHDHDLSTGRHHIFSMLAHFLAEIGVASVRYDSRGVGLSSGDFYSSTLEDLARDAIAVWEQMRQIEQIDPLRIGILSLSEGGVVGPMAASWESRIAFLILLSPPGLTGAEISMQQIDRMSEIQGMSEENRDATNALQSELQSLASGYVANEDIIRKSIRDTINQNWNELQKIAIAQDPKADLTLIKEGLITDIENRFQQLRQPWYQFYLKHDPGAHWMLIRQPTLALWGEKDVEILAEPNAIKIDGCTKRNRQLDVTLEILPDLNHRLQTCKTGLPDEYETISETMSPVALGRIRIWLEEQGLIGKK